MEFYLFLMQVFRRAQEPKDLSVYDKNFFNLLIEYNSTAGRNELPLVFEYLKVSEFHFWI